MRRRESRETRLLNRREFGGLCVALSSFVTSSALALDAASAVASTGAGRTVKFRDGIVVPVLGQGSGHVGAGKTSGSRRPACAAPQSRGLTNSDLRRPYPKENVDIVAKDLHDLAERLGSS